MQSNPNLVVATVQNSSGTGTTYQVVTLSDKGYNGGSFVDLSAPGSLGASPLVLYNWNPSAQLKHFLNYYNSQNPSQIVAIGDSETRGAGASSLGWSGLSWVSEATQALNSAGVQAQGDNFYSSGLNPINGQKEDNRITLVGGAQSSGQIDAGGSLIATSAAGQGFDFDLNQPGNYNRVTLSWVDQGSGSVSIGLNGGTPLTTVQFGNTGQTLSKTITIPSGNWSELNVRALDGNQTLLEGASFWNSQSPAIVVRNAGIDGLTAQEANQSVSGEQTVQGSSSGVGETAGVIASSPSLVIIDLGMADLLGGTGSPESVAANLTTMITNLRGAGSDVILVVPQPWDDSTYTNGIGALRTAIQGVADQTNTGVIDLGKTFNDNPDALYRAGLLSDLSNGDATLSANVGSAVGTLLAQTIQAAQNPATLPGEQIKLTDDKGARFTTGIQTSGRAVLSPTITGLDNTVVQTVGTDGTDTISTPQWGMVKTVNIQDVSGGSFATNAFVEADATLSGATKGKLILTSAKRGVISLTSGNYNVLVNAASDAPDPTNPDGTTQHLNDFVFSLGSGNNVVTVHGAGTASHVAMTTGSGHAILYGADGGNQVTFGSGRAEVTGGKGEDDYLYHAKSGIDIIQNFDPSKDTLSVDAGLKQSMHVDHSGGKTILWFGTVQHQIVLSGLPGFDPNSVKWV